LSVSHKGGGIGGSGGKVLEHNQPGVALVGSGKKASCGEDRKTTEEKNISGKGKWPEYLQEEPQRDMTEEART